MTGVAAQSAARHRDFAQLGIQADDDVWGGGGLVDLHATVRLADPFKTTELEKLRK